MDNKSLKKKKKKRQFTRRHGVALISILAAMILVVNLVVFSYSWFQPKTVEAKGLEMNLNASLRSEKCTFETYQGTLVTESNWNTLQSGQEKTFKDQGYYIDQVAYNEAKIADNVAITIPAATIVHDAELNEDVTVPGRVYFRTNIQNTDTQYPSVISLYHHQMLADVGVAITYPSNTYHRTEEVYDDYFILRNAYVKVKNDADVDGPGLLIVEWFVENFDTSATKSIRVTPQTVGTETIQWLYLMYN